MTTVRSPFDVVLRFNNNSVIAEGKSKSLRIIEQSSKTKSELEQERHEF